MYESEYCLKTHLPVLSLKSAADLTASSVSDFVVTADIVCFTNVLSLHYRYYNILYYCVIVCNIPVPSKCVFQ